MYRKILVGGVTAAAILGAGTAALATTGSESTNGSPTPGNSTSSPSTHSKSKHKHSPLSRAAHAKITVKTKKGYVTRDLIRGTVTAVSATSITVQAGDKTSETFVVGGNTKVLAKTKGAKPTASAISKVSTGQRVVVNGTGSSTLTATHIVDLGSK